MILKYAYTDNEENNTLINQNRHQTAKILILKLWNHGSFAILPKFWQFSAPKSQPFEVRFL